MLVLYIPVDSGRDDADHAHHRRQVHAPPLAPVTR